MNRAIDTLYGRKKGTNSSMYPHFLLEETEIICIFMQHWLVHMKIILMFNVHCPEKITNAPGYDLLAVCLGVWQSSPGI